MSLTGQWQCLKKVQMGTLKKCHWPVNDSFQNLRKCHWPFNDSVSKMYRWGLLGSVMDRSMTFSTNMLFQGAPLQNVIDWSVTFFTERGGSYSESKNFWSKFSKKCHWPINDIFLMDIISLAYGQMSLTSVNDKKLMDIVIDRGQWPLKVSLTAVNDKKVSLTASKLYMEKLCGIGW